MQFKTLAKSLALATTLLAALTAPVSAQIKEHTFKVGIGLSDDHPQAQAVRHFAERLQAKPHGVVALVSRCEARGFVKRQPSASDRRQVEVHLLAEGERILTHLASLHRTELRSLADVFSIPTIHPLDANGA